MTATPEMKKAAIALNRFGLGARPDEPLPADPKRWLLAQFEKYTPTPPSWAGHKTGAELVVAYGQQFRALQQADAANELAMRQKLGRDSTAQYRASVDARALASLTTPTPFAERLVHFWANHFAVSIEKPPLASVAGAYELEAIRPHVFGRFEDMLLAVERHPAMLLYLDQTRSIGPGSRLAQRTAEMNPQRPRGLNENLAREILELHTLGVRSGYSQADVTEFARALTGWSLVGAYGARATGPAGSFAFQPALHEPGQRMVLGRRYEDTGESQAVAVLHDLATAPATARHIATKLARHFAGDMPPATLVDRLAESFTRSSGNLPDVYRTLVDSPEVWEPAQAKFKTPWDWALSSLRGLGWTDLHGQPFSPMLVQLGQPAWRPGSPAGFDDIAASWAAPDALVRRVEVAQRLADQAGSMIDARTLAPKLLPDGPGPATMQAVSRAESPAIALALLLASPEFLRR